MSYSNPFSIKSCVGYSTMSNRLNVIEPLQEKWWHRTILYQYHVQLQRKTRFIANVGTINLQISFRIIKMRPLETNMVTDSYYAYVMWTNLQLLSHVMYLSLLLSTNYSTFINHLLIVSVGLCKVILTLVVDIHIVMNIHVIVIKPANNL